ncbi:TetR/AcrR family transcriptional regulator [Mycobacterium sp. 050128]|uniref:TetR/AcrR family transcriptional regulator n=1 Tax=Mycobacterium sp. 050128 TaxID=3096112 RepID=UPI002ED8DD4F
MGIQKRRSPNPEERRRILCDAAIQLLADEGAKGLSHPKVDKLAEVPNGTTSFYFRTRSALLMATAQRLAELDLVDLMSVAEPTGSEDAVVSAHAPRLATMVMLSGAEPRLSRTKARFELMLQANRDRELAEVFRHNNEVFADLHRREILARSKPGFEPEPDVLEEQTAATMCFLGGVHIALIGGDRFIRDAEQLDRLLRAVADGVAAEYREEPKPRRRRAGKAG